MANDRRIVLAVHGSVDTPKSVVLTKSEYASISADQSYFQAMQALLRDYTLLFVGFGHNDPDDLDRLFGSHVEYMRAAAGRQFTLMRGDPKKSRADVELERRLWDTYRIEAVWLEDFAQLVPTLRALAKA